MKEKSANKISYDILYQSDENYAPVLAVSVISLIKNNKNLNFRIVIIDCGLTSDSRQKISKMISQSGKELLFVSQSDLEKKLKNSQIAAYSGFRKNKKSYLKILYPYYEDAAQRIVFIDCDTIIKGSIKPLLLMDLKGKIMAAVMDSTVDQEYKNIIGLTADEPYYNSGVMVIDTNAWIQNRVYEKIQEQIDHGIKYNTVDQDYINMAVRGKCISLDCRYNFQPFHLVYCPATYLSVFHKEDTYYTADELNEGRKNIVILHFFRYLGLHPWDKKSLHPDEREFKKWLQKTPWSTSTWKRPHLDMIMVFERVLYLLLPKIIFLKLFKFMHDKMLHRK